MNPGNQKSFTFFSQNTQGHRWETQTELMNQFHHKDLSVAALQESGRLAWPNLKPVPGVPELTFAKIKPSSGAFRTRRSLKDPIHGLFMEWKGNKGRNSRVSMAMLSRHKPLRSGIVKSKLKGVRPMMYMAFKDHVVTNLHLPSGRPTFAAKVLHGFLESLDGASGITKRNRSNTLILGDFNMDGSRATKTATAHGFSVSSPLTPTHQSGSTLDHAMYSGGTVSALDNHFTYSDHTSVAGRYTFK